MKRRLPLGILLLLVMVLLTGCLGGGGSAVTDEQKIHTMLNKYETAMKSKNAEGLVALMYFSSHSDASKDVVRAMLEFFFTMVDSIPVYKIESREIIVSNNAATVEGRLRYKMVATTGEIEEGIDQFIGELIKVNNQWKINGDSEVIL